MKRNFLFFIILILSVFIIGCSSNNSNTSNTQNPNISFGVKKLTNEVITLFDDYKNAAISKTDFTNRLKDISEQIKDISDTNNYVSDYMIEIFIDELYEKLGNENCDLDDLSLPYEDLKSVLNNTYTYSDYNTSYDVGNLKLYLSDEWTQDENETNSFSLSTGTKNASLTIDILENQNTPFFYAIDDDDFKASLIKAFTSDNQTQISNDTIYKTRDLNYFYIFEGTFKGEYSDSLLRIAFLDDISTKTVYRFIYLSLQDDETEFYNILNEIPNIE